MTRRRSPPLPRPAGRKRKRKTPRRRFGHRPSLLRRKLQAHFLGQLETSGPVGRLAGIRSVDDGGRAADRFQIVDGLAGQSRCEAAPAEGLDIDGPDVPCSRCSSRMTSGNGDFTARKERGQTPLQDIVLAGYCSFKYSSFRDRPGHVAA
ncbi:hypothetical protein RHEC894_PA00019 (plasmid) [Rhizobium sp. CIAT894]|nr:hypothetical protein RHEC894_PA00019 [Rhizobium sp. CIAT894]